MILALNAIACFPQQARIDSLISVLGLGKEDTNSVNALNQLSIYNWQTGDYAKSKEYALKALELGKKLKVNNDKGWPKGIAIAYANIGTVSWYTGAYPEALKNYLASLKINEELKNKNGIAVSYNNLAIVYLYQENFEMALKYYKDALGIFEAECGPGIVSTDEKCLQGMAACHNNIGNTYYSQGKNEEALDCFLKALKIRERLGKRQDIAGSYNNIAIIYETKGQDKEALDYYFRAMKITEELGDKATLVGLYINLGSYHTRLKNFGDGRKFLSKALLVANEIGSVSELKECYADLAALDSCVGNYRESLGWYKLFIRMRDSLSNEENTKRSVKLEMQYAFDKKEAATKLEQEKKDVVAQADARRQRIILLAISGFGILIFGFAIFAYRSFLQKKRANIEITSQKELIEEKQKEILDSIYYAKRIQTALLPHDKYINRNLKKLRV